ncbi:MAG: glycerophosphodiester phosphodiesterase [Colwellia sp.]|nr:glycerophosphodiester phosphodiesterase [Colwellia sp.]
MKIIAHRGASGEFPENTLLAFEQAIIQQADGIELDARYHHQSGQFLLLHDDYISDENGEEFHYNDITLSSLLTMTVGSQPITTLGNALTAIDGRCLVNIELKVASTKSTDLKEITSALHLLFSNFIQKQHFCNSQLVISSFNHHLLARIDQEFPQLNTAALIACCPLQLAKFAQDLGAQSINPSINCLHNALIEDAHQKGIEVWVYVVDRKRDIARCLQLGVDAIFTNHPNRTKLIVEELLKT